MGRPARRERLIVTGWVKEQDLPAGPEQGADVGAVGGHRWWRAENASTRVMVPMRPDRHGPLPMRLRRIGDKHRN